MKLLKYCLLLTLLIGNSASRSACIAAAKSKPRPQLTQAYSRVTFPNSVPSQNDIQTNERLNISQEQELLVPKPVITVYSEKVNFNNQEFMAFWRKSLIEKVEFGEIILYLSTKTIGTINYQRSYSNNSCYISRFRMEPEWRGKKIGANFIQYSCKKFVDDKINHISLQASPFELAGIDYVYMLPRLINFYKSCGFENRNGSNYMIYKIPREEPKKPSLLGTLLLNIRSKF